MCLLRKSCPRSAYQQVLVLYTEAIHPPKDQMCSRGNPDKEGMRLCLAPENISPFFQSHTGPAIDLWIHLGAGQTSPLRKADPIETCGRQQQFNLLPRKKLLGGTLGNLKRRCLVWKIGRATASERASLQVFGLEKAMLEICNVNKGCQDGDGGEHKESSSSPSKY